MGNVLKEFLDEYGLQGGIEYAEICRAYDWIVGPSVSSATTGISFQNGILTCRINSSVIRTQLTFKAEDIREGINARVGKQVVKAIKFS